MMTPHSSEGARAAPSHLLERDDELEAIKGALGEAHAGEGRIAIIGAAGLGKTRLLETAAELGGAQGWLVANLAEEGELLACVDDVDDPAAGGATGSNRRARGESGGRS